MLAGDASGIVLPQDVPALAEIAPDELDDLQLVLLGRLVRRSLDQSDKPGALLEALHAGTSRLGGTDPARRLAAAKLLLGAGLTDEAAEYLPPIEPALASGDAPVINLHARRQYLIGRQKRDSEALTQSWAWTLAVLDRREVDEQARAPARRRALALAPKVPAELAAPWLRRVLRDDPVAGLSLLMNVAEQAAAALALHEAPARIDALRLEHLAAQAMLEVEIAQEPDWNLALQMLTRHWIVEAQKAAGGEVRRIMLADDQHIAALPLPFLLEVAPDDRWLTAIDSDTADHSRHLIGLLAARSGREAQTLAVLRELAPRNSELARDLAETFLVAAVKGGGEEGQDDDPFDIRRYQRMSPRMRQYYLQQAANQRRYSSGRGDSGRIVTRAGQLRNLARLNERLKRLKEAGVPPLGEAAVMAAFAVCHSPAEVFREEDAQRVFGPSDQWTPEAALQLARSLREGLAQQWRDPQVQQQAGTKRTPREQVAEIERGYTWAARLLTDASAKAPENIEAQVLLAGVYFDHAEFLYGQEVELATYVALRDAAFKTFERAAAQYARTVAASDEQRYDIDVYREWFQAALGTSDLSFLTRQDEPDQTQVQRIAASLQELAEPARDKHLALFAAAIDNSLSQTPPSLKEHVVRHALAVLGDHPSAKPLIERLSYYDELLKEVELRLVLDGGDRVGRGRPFGVHISLAATQALHRENGNFAEVLQQLPPHMSGAMDDMANHRKLLEQELREKLAADFAVEALVFHAPQTRPRACGRSGWQELPIAYAVLRTKDEAVDRLPPVQLDLDFADGGGPVRLPVRSQVTLIDARDDAPPPRPARDLKVKQVLDDRQLSKGSARLEITATARGLAPELDSLFADGGPRVPGFEISRVVEEGLAISSLEAGEQVEVQSERRWLVELVPATSRPPARFTFPRPANGSLAVAHQRYDDADLVDCSASVPLRGATLSAVGRWLWPVAACGGLALCAAGVAIAFARRRKKRAPQSLYRPPAQLTPFSLHALLSRMQADQRLSLSRDQRRELGDAVRQLDDQFFTREAADAAPNLEAMLHRWLSVIHPGGSFASSVIESNGRGENGNMLKAK
jgi:hypothetical protein